jgi:hypothetical protein
MKEEGTMQDRKKPETLRLRALMPSLTANDLQASVAFYRDVLGSDGFTLSISTFPPS